MTNVLLIVFPTAPASQFPWDTMTSGTMDMPCLPLTAPTPGSTIMQPTLVITDSPTCSVLASRKMALTKLCSQNSGMLMLLASSHSQVVRITGTDLHTLV